MNIAIVASPGARHQVSHASALKAGLKRHGIDAQIVNTHNAARSETVACWGWRTCAVHRASGRQVLVMERGYIGDRFAWTSLGWNGLNGRATFGRREDGGERFRAHHAGLMKPWRAGGSYVLIAGQVPGDAALAGRCLRGWYEQQAQRAAAYGLPVKFRAHPLAYRRGGVSDVPGAESIGGELADNLQRAALVITYNSNTAVESILAGVPTVAVDAGSMAWDVALPDLPKSLAVPEPDRLTWAHRLAWNQFTLAEIESGFAWEVAGSAAHG